MLLPDRRSRRSTEHEQGDQREKLPARIDRSPYAEPGVARPVAQRQGGRVIYLM